MPLEGVDLIRLRGREYIRVAGCGDLNKDFRYVLDDETISVKVGGQGSHRNTPGALVVSLHRRAPTRSQSELNLRCLRCREGQGDGPVRELPARNEGVYRGRLSVGVGSAGRLCRCRACHRRGERNENGHENPGRANFAHHRVTPHNYCSCPRRRRDMPHRWMLR